MKHLLLIVMLSMTMHAQTLDYDVWALNKARHDEIRACAKYQTLNFVRQIDTTWTPVSISNGIKTYKIAQIDTVWYCHELGDVYKLKLEAE